MRTALLLTTPGRSSTSGAVESRVRGSVRRSGGPSTSHGCAAGGPSPRNSSVEVHALAVPRALRRERSARITSPWAVGAIVAAFYLLLTGPGLIHNPYQFINIGRHFHAKASSSTVINHARTIDS